MNEEQNIIPSDDVSIRDMLSGSGYSDKAISYFLDKTYMGDLPQADHETEMTGTCGDTMKVCLKINQNIIKDIRYQVLGCPGAVASAMAAAELVKGKRLEDARAVNDNDIFNLLEEIPDKKHHCIQLAVKTLHKTLDEYQKAKM
ncbi:iron-sulfur cluster assembly scaffold protein [Desulfococcaceae bacterium HSG7]|nr:iron-sulfur cluster assembly scaffold protein [Desulfococcaceae bacterium HSG7]